MAKEIKVTADKLLKLCEEIAYDRKAENIVRIDLKEVAAVSDYDKNFYDELNSIHKELNSLSKRTHIVRF